MRHSVWEWFLSVCKFSSLPYFANIMAEFLTPCEAVEKGFHPYSPVPWYLTYKKNKTINRLPTG